MCEGRWHLRLDRIAEWSPLALLRNVRQERVVDVFVELLENELVRVLVQACASGEARFFPNEPLQDRDLVLVTFARRGFVFLVPHDLRLGQLLFLAAHHEHRDDGERRQEHRTSEARRDVSAIRDEPWPNGNRHEPWKASHERSGR